MKLKYLILGLLPMLAACSSDEVVPEVAEAMPINLGYTLAAQSRGFGLDTKLCADFDVQAYIEDAVTGEEVTLTNYTIATDGSLEPPQEKPVFPTNGNPVNIYAFHRPVEEPVFEGHSEMIILDNQLNELDYGRNDLCFAVLKNVQPTTETIILPFRHLFSKVEVTINVDEDLDEIIGLRVKTQIRASLSLVDGSPQLAYNLEDYQWFDMCHEACPAVNEAIIFPTAYAAGMELLQVVTYDQLSYKSQSFTYSLPDETIFEAGKKYCFNLTFESNELTITMVVKDWESGADAEEVTMEYYTGS